MLSIIVTIVSCGILLIQSLGFYELIPLLSYSAFGNVNIILLYIHSCLCKWGLPFSALGLLMGLLVLFDKDNKFNMRSHMAKYAVIFSIWALLSFL